MNRSHLKPVRLKFAIFAVLSLLAADIAGAQTYFTQTGFGDLVAGFRKTGSFAENNEMAVYLGNVTNFLKLSIGTTINITNYSHLQITNMCPDNLANLQWSVFSSVQTIGFPEGPWVTPVGTFPKATCWYTLPRTDVNTQTATLNRFSYAFNSSLRSKILGVSTGAHAISQSLSTTNQFNNALLVTEPIANSDHIVTAYIGDPSDPTYGDFGGTPFVYGETTVENTTPDPFSSPVRSDFYQSCPAGVGFVDPFTGTTNGAAYFVGYFTLNTDGTMTFTRAAASTGVPNPPPPPVLTISSSTTSGGGGSQVNSMISFTTTNGATYTLRYTNSAGLTAPVTNWAIAAGSITGDGSIHSFTNSSTDGNRFYRVSSP